MFARLGDVFDRVTCSSLFWVISYFILVVLQVEQCTLWLFIDKSSEGAPSPG
jgi:hypothetical protein